MTKVMNVEKKIQAVEGFAVKIMKDGKDVRGDKEGLPQYVFQNAAKNDMTVADYKKLRFSKYLGYDVDVLDAVGDAVHGSTKLSTVRDTYLEDEE